MPMHPWSVWIVYSICLIRGFGIDSGLVHGQTSQPDKRVKRVRPPAWTELPAGVFFEDAFRDGLVGPRPASLGNSLPSKPSAEPTDASEPIPAGGKWSALISAEVLEDEVKSLQMATSQNVTTPGKFTGGGYKLVRRDFSILALLFAVIGEYDGDVRWHQQAPAVRDQLARAAANAKVSSIQAFNEAKQRKLDLQDLVRGGTLDAAKPAERMARWDRVCDRGPLMQRLAIASDERLAPWTASETEFRRNADEIRHEAAMTLLLAEVLTRDGMEDGDDEAYADFCRQLQTAAREVIHAAEQQDAVRARRAVGEISKSCNNCHEHYRA